jgi:hypothetical protein
MSLSLSEEEYVGTRKSQGTPWSYIVVLLVTGLLLTLLPNRVFGPINANYSTSDGSFIVGR